VCQYVFICFRFGERSVLTTSRPRRCRPRCRPRRCRTRRRGSPSRKAPTSSRTPTRRRSSRRTRRASSRRRRLSTSRRRRRGRTPPTPSRRGADRPTAGAPLPLHLQSKGGKIGGPVGNVSLHSSNDSGFSNDPPPQPEIDYSDDDSIPGQTKLPAR
jgi:hypothetical protein